MTIEDQVTTTPEQDVAAPRRPAITATQLTRASVGLGGVTLWLAALGLITTPIMIHHLGTARYGVFALISIMSAYLSNLEFGFGHATVRFLGRARAEGDAAQEGRVADTSLTVFLAGGLTAAALAFFGAPWFVNTFFHGPQNLHAEATDAVRLGALILLLSFLSSFAAVGLQSIARFPTVVWSRAIFGTLASVVAVAAVLVGGHLRLVLAAQAAVAGGLCLVMFVSFARAAAIRLRPRIHRATLRSMAVYGGFVLLSGLAYQVLLQGPPTVLAHLATATAVAAFAVPNLILQQLALVATSTSIGFMPFATAAAIDPDRGHLAAVFRSNLRVTLLFVGPVAVYLAVFSRTLLTAWIDASFAARATPALEWLSLAAVMLALSAAPADVVRGAGHPRWIAVFTAVTAALAVGLSFALARSDGAGGAGLALAGALVITTPPFIALVSGRLLALRLRELAAAFAGPLAALTLLAAILLAGRSISGSLAMAVVSGAVGAGVYAMGAFRFVLDDSERRALTRTWSRVAPRSPQVSGQVP
jgi:O-antigen/teichoic acid export membrane protein